jgi:hypothetical protein
MITGDVLTRAFTKLGGMQKVASQTKEARRRWLDDGTLSKISGIFKQPKKRK